nr:putative reverse transcriptase domain-containing protein [Tanacetum cinerariifolium]
MEIRQFLDLAGYYGRFNDGFSKIAKSMTKLTQKGVKFDWGEKEENAFQLIKQKLCSAPIMALPKGSEDFVVYSDALHKGLGVVLMQREKTGAPQGEELGLMKPLSESSYSCSDNSFILDEANRYGARATGRLLESSLSRILLVELEEDPESPRETLLENLGWLVRP